MTNRVTLEQLGQMTAEEFITLPVDQVAMLLEDVAELKARAKASDEKMSHFLDRRFSEAAARLRAEQQKDTGTVRLPEGEFVIVADLPKKVEWNEDGLLAAEVQLREMGEPVEEYIKIRRTVAESAFVNWPSSLQGIFSAHRTVGVGKPTYKIERAKKAAGRRAA
jgi:hypothetical protein